MNNLHQLIIAHRGESFDAPENTLAAINLAWERGAGAVEIDIQLTSDNKIVVIHDYDTLRITGVKLKIKDTSYSYLLKLDFGGYKNEKYKNESIPNLTDVLKTVPDNGRIIIEIKSDYRILNYLQQELSNSTLKNSQIEIIAFDFETLTKARQLMPDYKMLWLLDLDYSLPHWLVCVNKKRIIKKVKDGKLNGVNVWAGKVLNRNFISTFKEAGLLVYTWTVNDKTKALELLEFGIDAITTDKAAWLTKQVSTSNI